MTYACIKRLPGWYGSHCFCGGRCQFRASCRPPVSTTTDTDLRVHTHFPTQQASLCFCLCAAHISFLGGPLGPTPCSSLLFQRFADPPTPPLAGMNMLVCTPGRLLQHMDETPGFDASQVQVLVLDEADRILDMGFSATLNAILQNLPQERQTMLFSATQTKSVKDLARLSLKAPEYIAVHAEAATPTPVKLQQVGILIPLPPSSPQPPHITPFSVTLLHDTLPSDATLSILHEAFELFAVLNCT